LQKIVTKYKLIFTLFIFVFFSLTTYAQKKGFFVIKAKIKLDYNEVITKDKSKGSITVNIKKNGQNFKTSKIDNGEKFNIELEFNSTYEITVSKDGFISKISLWDLTAPPDRAEKGWEWILDGSLFPEYNGVNYTVFTQPVLKVYYDAATKKFDFDTNYSKMIQSQIEKAMEDNKKAEEQIINKDKNEEKAKIEAAKKAEAEAKAKAEEQAKKEAEAKKKAEAEAKAKAEAEEKAKKEAEAKKKAEEDAKRKAEEEARKKADAEAKAKADAEAKARKEEEAKKKAEADAKAKAEADAKKKAEEEAKAKAEADALAKKSAEERKKAEADAKAKAEADAKKKTEEEAKAKADADALSKKSAEEQKKAEADAKAKAEADAKKKIEEDAKAKADADARKKADEKALADAETKRKAEEKAAEEKRLREEAKAKAEDETRKKAEENAKKKAEADAKAKELAEKNKKTETQNPPPKTEKLEKLVFKTDTERKKYQAELSIKYPEGVWIEYYEQFNRQIKRVIVNKGGIARDYRMEKTTFGIFYNRDGQNISEHVFILETKE